MIHSSRKWLAILCSEETGLLLKVDGVSAALVEFASLVEEHEFHALLFQHLALCERRAWLHLHRIDYAHLDERMAKGAALHDAARPRDSSVAGLFGLAPDRIDWDRGLVIEAKGGGGARDAVMRQVAFYAMLLTRATGREWRPCIEVIGQKRLREHAMTSELVFSMLADARRLVAMKGGVVPAVECSSFCDMCSYRHFCRV